MSIDKIIVTITGLFGVAFTYWFFLMKREEEVVAKDEIDIIVEGGYSPSTIVIPKGRTTIINFFRKDPSSCLEEIIISEFKIKKYLPLNQKLTVEVLPDKTGEFPFSCGMNMFHGKIIVKG